MECTAFNWFEDGWLGADGCFSVVTKGDLRLSFFLPQSEEMPPTKRLHIYDERTVKEIEVARGVVTPVLLDAPSSGNLVIQVYADYAEYESPQERRTLGAVVSIAPASGDDLRINRREPAHITRPILGHRERDLVAAAFDADFYCDGFPPNEVPFDPLLHFLIKGWRNGRDPSADFSLAHYLAAYPDIAHARLNPLVHYLIWGKAEGRSGLPRNANQRQAAPALPTNEDLDRVRPFFDPGFYRRCYPDITGDDENLLIDFMSIGWKLERDPSPHFSTGFYLRNYPDIARGGVNPFLHYVLHGKFEGRRGAEGQEVPVAFDPKATTIPAHLASVMLWPKADERPAPPPKTDQRRLDLHWVIPDFSAGSGGHMTIFRIVRLLEKFGHTCTIWIEQPTMHKSASSAYDDIVKYFQCVAAEVRFLSDGFFSATGDAVIATGWSTAYPVARATGFAGKFYFVQDHEPEFYASGTESILAKESYSFDLACICASPWLDDLMSKRYGRWARHFFLAYDKDVYFQTGTRSHRAPDNPLRIAVYSRDHTPRRCVPLALMALERLAASDCAFELHFFGQQQLPFRATPYPAQNHGILSATGLAALYNRCDIGISFSATNYSLVPQEMMACGLPVLELDVESTRRVFPDGVVTRAPTTLDGMVAALRDLIDSAERRSDQAAAALNWVSQFDWESAARTTEKAIIDYLREQDPARIPLHAPSTKRARSVALDVVIPTWNGLNEIPQVIDALRRQHDSDALQIYCIDSSSSDGTQEWLRKQKDVSLTVIPQADFQHGRTRNHGAALGKAPLISFLTQDATPATATWMYDIRRMFDHHPDAAGLFGRHIAYPHHPTFVHEELDAHFAGFLRFPLAVSRDTDPAKWESGELGWRQFLHFYSDNNSAMRRDVWKEIPYPEVSYGEDQVWARDIIEAGLTKLYAPTATVYHSHDYGPEETYQRSRIESGFFYTHFGYRQGDGSEDEVASRIKSEQTTYLGAAIRKGIAEAEISVRLSNIEAKHRGWRDGLNAAIAKNRSSQAGMAAS